MKRMRLLLIACCVAVGTTQAQQSVDVAYWPAAKLKGHSTILKARMPTDIDGKKQMVAADRLAALDNEMFITRRDESGDAEIHADWIDLHVGQEGEATIVYGGKLEGGRTIEPGEISGGKIVGGVVQKMGPGDVVVIPAGVPHQTLVEKGKHWTALVVKIEKR